MQPPVALLRFIRYGKVRRASPHVLVHDDGELVALFIPAGAPAKVAAFDGRPIRGQADRDWTLRDHVWDTYDVLRLIRFGTSHSVELFWRAGTAELAAWYVNIQEPLRRVPSGFDTDDLVLDLWIEPEGTVHWKDEDELAIAVELGRFTPEQADAIRAEAERVVEERPWPTGWEEWRPDPAWPLPQLPQEWDVVPEAVGAAQTQ